MASAAALSTLAKATQDDELILSSLAALLPLSPPEEPAASPPHSPVSHMFPTGDNVDEVYRHQIPSIGSTIAIRQLPSQGLSFQLWPAATALVSLLDLHRRGNGVSPLSSVLTDSCRGRRLRILELGSGTGLVGISAAAILGAEVTLTDLSHVVPNLRFNAAVNAGLVEANGGAVEVAELSWGDEDEMARVGKEYDLIVGSDVVYHDHLYEPLLKTLKYFLLGSSGDKEGEECVFLMAHLKRWKKESSFFNRAKKAFDVKVLHREDPPPPGKRVGVNVYRFAPKRQRL